MAKRRGRQHVGVTNPDVDHKEQQVRFGVVTFPGLHGHPKSRKIAEGAFAMAHAFRQLLQRADKKFTQETVTCPKRPPSFVEAATQWTRRALTRLRLRQRQDTDALRYFEKFRKETEKNYRVTRAHLLAGERLFHAAASHDAIGRVLALKSVQPDALIVHFDQHPDAQAPGSGDNPGDTTRVNGHAVWRRAVDAGEESLLNHLRPEGSRTLDRSDIFSVGIMHADPSEEAWMTALIDQETHEQIRKPVPQMTADELGLCGEVAQAELYKRLREWIDDRKAHYGVSVIHVGIEDDPDSVDIKDIGTGTTVPSHGGMTSEFKRFALEWLRKQSDVQISYYGTCEVIPKYDPDGTLQLQVLRWAAAALGFKDPQYFYGGYGGGTERDRWHRRESRAKKALPTIIGATAASILTLIGANVLNKHDRSERAQDTTLAQYTRPYTNRDTAAFLRVFAKESGFKEQLWKLREASQHGDRSAAQKAIDELARIYKAAEQASPNPDAKHYLAEVALSEFQEGFGGTGEMYQRFVDARRKA